MNKILVLFDSATGNVQQMAELIGEGAALVPDTEVRTQCGGCFRHGCRMVRWPRCW